MSMTTWYVIAGGLALNAVLFGWFTACLVLTQHRQRKARRALNAATEAHILLDREIEQALEIGHAARDWALWSDELTEGSDR